MGKILGYPALVGVYVFGAWVLFAFIEQCFSSRGGHSLSCGTGTYVAFVFIGMAAVLSAAAALLARLVLHRWVRTMDRAADRRAALISSVLLVATFYVTITWKLPLDVLGPLGGWATVSFFLCSGVLLGTWRLTRRDIAA
ncbi:MAG: hypothetical protein K0U93_24630 [Gammaproteobacteria bacterium]|nr:hypothetical protein [Gammaproteobacteria bacterium]